MSNYSMGWNKKANVWIAKVKKPDGSGWITKWISSKYTRSMEIEATLFLTGWIVEYYSTYGTVIPKNYEVVSTKKTLAFLGPKWLQMREAHRATKINTYNGLKLSMNNWILDNPKFKHTSIQDLDLEQDFSVSILRGWIDSIGGSVSSRLQHIGALRSFFNDAINEGFLDSNMSNPLEKPAIKKLCKEIKINHRIVHEVSFLTVEQVAVLLTPNDKVGDYRQLRYLFALATGARDHEIQGLLWSDVVLDGAIPYVSISRQLDYIGSAPAATYEELVAKNYTKDQIKNHKQAVCSLPKYGSKRVVPLHPRLVKALEQWFACGWRAYTGLSPSSDAPIFPRSKTSVRTGKAGDYCFSESADLLETDLERLSLPTVSNGKQIVFHSLRHTVACFLEAAGVEDATIGSILGHSSRSVLRKHYLNKNLDSAYKAICKLPL